VYAPRFVFPLIQSVKLIIDFDPNPTNAPQMLRTSMFFILFILFKLVDWLFTRQRTSRQCILDWYYWYSPK
jgi:hypothetical protein